MVRKSAARENNWNLFIIFPTLLRIRGHGGFSFSGSPPLVHPFGGSSTCRLPDQLCEHEASKCGPRWVLLFSWGREWCRLDNRPRHGLIHHFLAEEWCAKQFVTGVKFFVHFSRQLVMGCRIGVKRHGNNDVFDWGFHVGSSHKFFRLFLPAATNLVGSGQRCPGASNP
jgi:hypothetical protein